jgi:hypothetical protein|tara:strand:+ start:295 stop:528 length:234 start_codon:yes stop_codon:yes gene_type:complete
MWKVELRPEVKRELKDPTRFVKGMENVYTGLTIAMAGVIFMCALVLNKPEDSLKPSWIILFGLSIIAWGEWQKYRSK